MLAALPPSSRVTFFLDPATALAIARPTSVEPVNATLSTSSCETIACPVAPAPVRMFTTPGGRSACWQISANSSAVRGVVSAGLSTTVLPAARAGAIFQASIRNGKFHGITWPGDAQRLRVRSEAGVLQLVGPAGVVEEVRRRRRDVDVARLLDRLAVVDRLQHGDLAGPLLDDPRDPEEVLAALGTAHLRPHPVCRRAGRPSRPGRRRPRRPRRPRRAPPRCSGEIVLNDFPDAVDELAVDEQSVGGLDVDHRAGLGGRCVLERRWPCLSPG